MTTPTQQTLASAARALEAAAAQLAAEASSQPAPRKKTSRQSVISVLLWICLPSMLLALPFIWGYLATYGQ